jgi:hypothetical protein
MPMNVRAQGRKVPTTPELTPTSRVSAIGALPRAGAGRAARSCSATSRSPTRCSDRSRSASRRRRLEPLARRIREALRSTPRCAPGRRRGARERDDRGRRGRDLTPGAGADPFARGELGPIVLRNRFIKSATFEGRAPKHVVSDDLIEFHRAVAAGGVAMTTLAYCAVSEDGQGAPGEIVVCDAAAQAARHRRGHAEHGGEHPAGHAGPVAAGTGRKGLAPSRVFAPQALSFTRAIDEAEIARITGDFARAARRSAEAGFDCVELHFGHGYLISAFLSPRLNKRRDRWGGSVANRARFARDVALAVREAVGRRVAVIAKLNMADGVPGGLWLDEASQSGASSKRTVRSTRSSSPAAARSRTRCTCSAASRRSPSWPRRSRARSGSASGSPPSASCRATRSRKPSSCRSRASSATRWRCR